MIRSIANTSYGYKYRLTRVFCACRKRAALLLMVTINKPNMPKKKALERNAKIKTTTALCKVYEERTATGNVNRQIQTGKNNTHPSITSRHCFNESGSCPLYGKRIFRMTR